MYECADDNVETAEVDRGRLPNGIGVHIRPGSSPPGELVASDLELLVQTGAFTGGAVTRPKTNQAHVHTPVNRTSRDGRGGSKPDFPSAYSTLRYH